MRVTQNKLKRKERVLVASEFSSRRFVHSSFVSFLVQEEWNNIRFQIGEQDLGSNAKHLRFASTLVVNVNLSEIIFYGSLYTTIASADNLEAYLSRHQANFIKLRTLSSRVRV